MTHVRGCGTARRRSGQPFRVAHAAALRCDCPLERQNLSRWIEGQRHWLGQPNEPRQFDADIVNAAIVRRLIQLPRLICAP